MRARLIRIIIDTPMRWIRRIIIAIPMRWIRRIIIAIPMITMLHCIIMARNSSDEVSMISMRIYANSSPAYDETFKRAMERTVELESLGNALSLQIEVTSYYLFWALTSGLLIALINQFDSTLKKTEALKRIESALIDLKDKMDRREG